MSKSTPGPLVVIDTSRHVAHIAPAATPRIAYAIATVFEPEPAKDGTHTGGREEMLANAYLFAGASDLLAACKIALNAFERNDAIDWSVLSDAISKAERIA